MASKPLQRILRSIKKRQEADFDSLISPLLGLDGVIHVGKYQGWAVRDLIAKNAWHLRGLVNHGWIRLTSAAHYAMHQRIESADCLDHDEAFEYYGGWSPDHD